MSFIKKVSLTVLVVALISLSAISLCACNADEEETGDSTRDLYIYDIGFSSEEEIATVYVTFSETDRKIDGASGTWHSEKSKDGEFYFVTTTTITLNPDAIFSAVKQSVPQEDLVHEEVEYNRLKVVLRYGTIYKSIKSDGQITRVKRTYVHEFALDESLENQVFVLEMRTQNSANWYAVLCGCALGAVLLIIVATLSVKGAKWQKTKTKE